MALCLVITEKGENMRFYDALIAILLLISFYCFAHLFYYLFAPLVRKHRFNATIKKNEMTPDKIIEKLKNDLMCHDGFAELGSLSIRFSHFADPHDATIRPELRQLVVSSTWIIDFYSSKRDSIFEYKELCWTIGHELGHYHFDDYLLPAVTRKNRLIHILREVRADNYGRMLSGLSQQQVFDCLMQDLKSTRTSLTHLITVTHPTWKDRLKSLKQFPTYNADLESQVKEDYCKKLFINQAIADNVSLIQHDSGKQ